MKGGNYDLEELIRTKRGMQMIEGTQVTPLEPLSPREREVFYKLCEGGKNKQIGQELSISPRTVETHRARILRKLNVGSVAQLVRFAIRNGLIAACLTFCVGCTSKLEKAVAVHDQNFRAVAEAHNKLEKRIAALEEKR